MNDGLYQHYVSNDAWMQRYRDYQQRYKGQIRESDRQILALIERVLHGNSETGSERVLELLDIGCSTGNLLKHIQAHFPQLSLSGGDMTQDLLEENRANSELSGMRFEFLDVLNLPESPAYDIITVNAVLYLLSNAEFERACASLSRALKPGGAMIVFDFFHPYEQHLEITESSRSHPKGLRLSFRPMSWASRVLEQSGFSQTEFIPFEIPIDLEQNKPFGDNSDGFEDLNSYTRLTHDQRRLLFRGALYQPWCHLLAMKAS